MYTETHVLFTNTHCVQRGTERRHEDNGHVMTTHRHHTHTHTHTHTHPPYRHPHPHKTRSVFDLNSDHSRPLIITFHSARKGLNGDGVPRVSNVEPPGSVQHSSINVEGGAALSDGTLCLTVGYKPISPPSASHAPPSDWSSAGSGGPSVGSSLTRCTSFCSFSGSCGRTHAFKNRAGQ